MNSLTRCPFGNAYDPSVHAECPCASCWADRSFATLSAKRGSQAAVPREAILEPEVRPAASDDDLRTPNQVPAETAASEPAIVGSVGSRSRIADVLSSFFSYAGRMDRGSYWTVIAVDIAVLWLVCLSFATTYGHSVTAREVASGIVIVTVLAFVVSIFSVCAKRLHDFDRSGGWCLVMCIGMLWLVIGIPLIGAYEGSPGRNRFGAPPPGWLRVGRE